jgi:hypothetical protein
MEIAYASMILLGSVALAVLVYTLVTRLFNL